MFSGAQTIIFGLMILVVAFVLRRSISQSKRSRKRDPISGAREKIRRADSSYTALLSKLEVKLHDYDREVSGRVDSKIVMLNRLLIEADEKIVRLEELQQQSEQPTAQESADRTTVYSLADAGLSAREIAEQTGIAVLQAQLILKLRPGRNREAG